nr:MAG TPA: tail protein [Caudoviricetes sp.]
MELNIYNQSGELKLTASVTSSSAWNLELMRENALSLTFTIPVCVPLQVNDYIILEGVRFSVKKEYKPRKKNSQKYSYSVKFYAPIHDAQQVVYLHLTDGQYEPQFSLDGSPREHLQKWVDNMNRIYGEERWRIGDVIDAPNQNIEYSNTTCWDALASMADIFSTEWWSDGFYINLCRCERGERVELGYGKGLTSLTQTENSDDVKFFTRLIPLGSTRNIDRSRYGFSRLQLPDRAKYVDRNTDYGLYEHVEEDAFAGIFPHYTGTVSSVRSQERTGNDGKPFTVYYFKDEGLEFDPCDYEIAGLVKQLSFQSGELNGRDFEANYHSESKEWEIINTYPDEDTQLPGGNLIPHAGDKYIPWNFRMPEAYEKQAEQDYKAAVDDFLSSYSEDTTKYGGDTDYTYIEKHSVPLRLGQSVRLLSEEYFPGSGYRDTRMTKVTRKLENLSMAAVECTNRVGKGWKRSLESNLNGLQYVVGGLLDRSVIEVLKSWDNREASEYNVFSALRSLAEFINKKKDDTAQGIITFLKGLLIGENGSGITVLENGMSQAVVDYLYVKIKAVFDELEVKKKTYVGGELVISHAGMKCIKVEELEDVYRCYMKAEEDGIEIENRFTPGSLAIAQECNIRTGVSQHVGNRYYWRLVTSVGKDYIDLSKTACDPNVENDIPAAGDDIVGLGHNTDITRQGAIILSSVNEVSPSILMYQGINDFTLVGKEVIGFDYDKATGKARMRVYGDAYIGAKDRSSYVEYRQDNGVNIKGRLHIEKGSSGWKNMEGLPDEIQAAVDLAEKAQDAIDSAAVGSVNLLRNSGFAGDYQSEELSAETRLSADAELYSKSLKHWSGMATVQDDSGSVSGKSVIVGSLSQSVSLMNQEVYVISYKAKGTSLAVSCGDYNVARSLTSEYQRYTHKLTFSGAGIFMLSGSATVCDIQLERGTIATDWKPSPLDNDKTMEKFQGIRYITNAIKNGSVDIIGGLILANMIQLGNYKDGKMQKVTAGISGIYNDDDDVADWAGGTFEQAIRTVMMYKNNPRYQPTVADLENMAKAVRTHGGRAILNDVILRGYVYALGGYFHGAIEQADGFNKMNEDGSVSFAGGKIRWGTDGKPVIEGKITTASGGKRIEVSAEENRIIMYNDAEQEVGRIDFVDSEYNGTILSLPRIRLKNVVTSNGVSSDVHSIYINPSSILMDQVFRDGTYSVLLNPSGLEFLKDGVRTKKYSNV